MLLYVANHYSYKYSNNINRLQINFCLINIEQQKQSFCYIILLYMYLHIQQYNIDE